MVLLLLYFCDFWHTSPWIKALFVRLDLRIMNMEKHRTDSYLDVTLTTAVFDHKLRIFLGWVNLCPVEIIECVFFFSLS